MIPIALMARTTQTNLMRIKFSCCRLIGKNVENSNHSFGPVPRSKPFLSIDGQHAALRRAASKHRVRQIEAPAPEALDQAQEA